VLSPSAPPTRPAPAYFSPFRGEGAFLAVRIHLPGGLEQFQSLGIDFVSLSENVDTSTPTGKMIFTVLGAVAELERSLIVERVKAGIRNARAKGKKLGRPRADVRESQIEGLRASGASWRAIAQEMGVGVGTVHRIGQRRSKNVCGDSPERQSVGISCPSELPT
jgi:DNA invertase Pin-like site-specific DNA recombinase